ncbi:MAG TPA: DUF58 domain-containing protein [Sphingobium sp.]|uniref:DUF58 domain-containing protein n=1 Tax=Sphingobium sp. TaxID=1912891 RepID=UPI002ED4DD53
MIYPTRTAIFTAAAGAPVALLVALVVPGHWYATLAWPLAVLLMVLADALTGAGPSAASARLEVPGHASVGADVDARLHVSITGKAPAQVQFALQTDALLEPVDDGIAWLALIEGRGAGHVPLHAARRGTARIDRLWLRWRGSFGLVWKQRVQALDTSFAILPDARPVRERGAQIFQRHSMQGLLSQVDRSDGTDFDALVEYRSGMDRRAIDWKQSARHIKLHAKEYRTERNNQIVFAVGSGRQMSEPVAGMSRLDRVVSAMLLTGWVALKLGDRVALHAFDSRPRIASGLVSGPSAFAELQRLAARIDYSGEETNYTHALTTLAAQLTRRSMIVLFTEFTDPTSAQFLVRAAARLVKTHLLLVVVLRDEELESIVDRRPETTEDVTRAVTAAALLRDRLTVLTQLRHLGVHVIESEHDRVPDRLVEAYVELKRRNLL